MRILNDEEIANAYGEGYGFEGDADALLKAQHQLDLKEFVGWLEKCDVGLASKYPEKGKEPLHCIRDKDWQSLKQLVDKK